MTQPGPTRLTLSADLREEVLAHARRERPREAVGLLGGRFGGRVTVALPLPNVAAGATRFIADPLAQFRALRRLESEGLQLLAIYHSHPGGGIDPSVQDLDYAKHWSCAQMIVALATRGESFERLGAFRFVATDSITDVPIEIRGAYSSSPVSGADQT